MRSKRVCRRWTAPAVRRLSPAIGRDLRAAAAVAQIVHGLMPFDSYGRVAVLAAVGDFFGFRRQYGKRMLD